MNDDPQRDRARINTFVEHCLSDGSLFKVGQLPAEYVWQDALFEAGWRLRPAHKLWISMYGRKVETPRYQQAYGADYRYSGQVNRALPIHELLRPLLQWSQQTIDARLNGLLLNFYEGASHYIGPHHDSTKNLIEGSPIVTISFGETRSFCLSRGKDEAKEERVFPAPAGTVFVLPYDTNLAWKHAVPKSAHYRGRRISVTLRAFASGVLTATEG